MIRLNIVLLLFISWLIGPKDKIKSSIQTVEVPRIDFVEMSEKQPHEISSDVIWFDDFSSKKEYLESSGIIDYTVNFGIEGGAMEAGFNKDDVNGKGNRKVAFGDFPGNGPILQKGKQFTEIYWRIYLKHERGWEGAPAKMSRATSIVASDNWKQAMIAHVWSGKGNSLTLDPARGVKEQTDSVKTNHYNDFDNLSWLGNSPASNFLISATEESGYWILVESMVRLNTPRESDGVNRLWIDGRLEAERKNLNLRGSYTKHGINAVFLESYWNNGAIKTENRWFDNFVISTKPIGPVTCPSNPVLHKTPYHGTSELSSWEVEIAGDVEGENIVFISDELGHEEIVRISSESGSFSGSLTGKSSLKSGELYYCRVRQKDINNNWSEWSRWHQGFRVE